MAFIDPPPEGSNEITNPDLFRERLLYKQQTFLRPTKTSYDPVPIDMIHEKPFYGKVDIYGNTVYPSEGGRYRGMKQLPGPGLILVHDFVAYQFKQLKNFLLPSLLSKERVLSSMFGDYVPKSATINFHQLYQKHFKTEVYPVFANDYITRPEINRNIKTFDDLVDKFVKFSIVMRDHFPITKTAFIMSPSCPNAVSGLIINLRNKLAADDDGLKYEQFISDPCFRKYVRVVSSYGFYVDKNVPWRIVANLDHPSWESAYASVGSTGLVDNHIFSEYFYKSEYFSYETLKSNLWWIYLKLSRNPDTEDWGHTYVTKNCMRALWSDAASHNFKTITARGKRKPISENYDTFQETYPDAFFLPIYLKIRASESRLRWKPRTFRSTLKRVLHVYDTRGITKALELIGDITKQSKVYLYNPLTKESLIRYFGFSTSSGLHSYLRDDIIQIDLEERAAEMAEEDKLLDEML